MLVAYCELYSINGWIVHYILSLCQRQGLFSDYVSIPNFTYCKLKRNRDSKGIHVEGLIMT
jgi:hypothetical protein